MHLEVLVVVVEGVDLSARVDLGVDCAEPGVVLRALVRGWFRRGLCEVVVGGCIVLCCVFEEGRRGPCVDFVESLAGRGLCVGRVDGAEGVCGLGRVLGFLFSLVWYLCAIVEAAWKIAGEEAELRAWFSAEVEMSCIVTSNSSTN